MPQPKKSGSSARKPASRKSAARKPQTPKSSRNRSGSTPPGGSRPASGRAARSSAAGDGARADGAHGPTPREDQLLDAIGSVRELLSKGLVLTAELLQETLDEAVKRGRMTRQDAEDLARNLVEIGRRQSQDALGDIEEVVGRSAKETRRLARARLKGVAEVARRAPGGERALRTVDRVRRVAGLGAAFPVAGYDDLTAAQVKERLADLDAAELRKVREHELRNANRKSVLTAIDRRLE